MRIMLRRNRYENYRDKVFCIFAGYGDKMNEFFVRKPRTALRNITELKKDIIVEPDKFTDKSDIPESGDCGTFYNNGCEYRKKPDSKISSILNMVLNRRK